MTRYLNHKVLPVEAVNRGWQAFVIDDEREYIFSIVDRGGHVLFTWYREPSLGEVLEKSREIIDEEVKVA